MKLDDMIRAVQQAVGVEADGNASPQTWGAIYNRICPNAQPPAPTSGDKVDDRSEKFIATLLPEVQPYARALVTKAAANGITIIVICGTRTYAEQDALYEQGRTKPGKIVTNARAGHSNHNFGVAFDIGVLGIDLGLEWGGNWKTIQDEPHFQLRPKWAANLSEQDMLAELRSRKDSGKGVYA
jgi:peptidoglycan L-alanyl-D-glutamate endopeptidase CwlK